MKYFLLILLAGSLPVLASIPTADGYVLPFSRKNYPLQELVKDYAEALKINVSWGQSFKHEKQGMDLFIHEKTPFKEYSSLIKTILDGRSYALMQSGNIYWISNARDIRYMATPFYGTDLPPNDESYGLSIIILKYPVASEISRNLRPFLSRWGRVIDFADGRTLALVEKGETTTQMHETIKFMDTEKVFKALLDRPARDDSEVNDPTNERIVELELKNKILEKKLMEQNGPVTGGMIK